MKTVAANQSLMDSPQFFFKQALTLFKKQQWTDSLQFLDAAIIFSHHSPFYLYQKVRFLYQSDHLLTCSQFIVSHLAYLYKHSSLYIFCRILDYLQKMNHYDLDYFCKLLKHHHIPYCLASCYSMILTQKDKPFAHLARQAIQYDDYILCLDFCELHCKLYPTTADICYMQAYSHHMLGHLQEGKNAYQNYLSFYPDDTNTYVHIALISMELNDYTSAIYYLKKANSLAPTNSTYLSYLAECYYATKNFSLAAKLYKQLLKQQSTNLQLYFDLAHTYKKMCKHRRSKRYIKLMHKTQKKIL